MNPDDDAFLDTVNVKDLGDICLKIFEVLRFREGGILPGTTKVADGKVHERTKKTMGHRVGWAQLRPVLRRRSLVVDVEMQVRSREEHKAVPTNIYDRKGRQLFGKLHV